MLERGAQTPRAAPCTAAVRSARSRTPRRRAPSPGLGSGVSTATSASCWGVPLPRLARPGSARAHRLHPRTRLGPPPKAPHGAAGTRQTRSNLPAARESSVSARIRSNGRDPRWRTVRSKPTLIRGRYGTRLRPIHTLTRTLKGSAPIPCGTAASRVSPRPDG